MGVPSSLFKYFEFDSAVKILENLRVRFTPPFAFNDLFEALPAFDLFDDDVATRLAEKKFKREWWKLVLSGQQVPRDDIYLAQRKPDREAALATIKNNPDFVRRRANAHSDQISSDIGALCLTENGESLLMWAHYADSHKGLLTEFDTQHLPFVAHTPGAEVNFRMLVPITYSTTRPRMKLGTAPVIEQVFLTKSAEWTYEKEWRVFRRLSECDKKLFVDSETIHLFNLPPKSIKRIVIGRRMTPKNRETVNGAIKANEALAHVQIQTAEPDLDNFSLNYV